ncbi:MAG: thiolase family protein [Syntrophobacterales bacterium]|nr:thiolase family protein [Syntrophobacterales bacterium]
MGKAVAIIGTGQTKHGRRSEVSYPDLVKEAVEAALTDAGITLRDIGGIVHGTMPSMMEGVSSTHLYFAEAIGAVGKPVMKVETCGSTGQSIAHCGYYWVASGMADVVMIVGSEKMTEGDGQATMTTVFDPFFQRTFAAGAPGTFTMQCMEWMYRFKIPEDKGREAAAVISVSNHDNAMENPYAHIRMKVTVEDVKKARIITYPVRLLDVCPSSDGACAVIFASEQKAKKICKKPAWIKGLGFRGEESFFGESDKSIWMSATEAAKEAYDQAGIKDPLEDLDVAEIYNPFTYQEMVFYECFGFCPRGEAPDYVLKGTFAKGGKLPCGPSGGTLCTNPIGATGLIRLAEAALQVTGKAGERQVEGAKVALSHAMGGVDQFNAVTIVGSEL